MAPDRLESWKAIAAYLRRGVRTVQRWELEEALPVRRHQHSRMASVYAHAQELDAWRQGRERPAREAPPAGGADEPPVVLLDARGEVRGRNGAAAALRGEPWRSLANGEAAGWTLVRILQQDRLVAVVALGRRT